MTLAASGQMGIGGSAPRSISVELGRAATATTSLGESAARTLAGVPSGAIRMGADFYGKSSATQVSFGAAGAGSSDLGGSGVDYPTGISAGHILILQVFAHEITVGAPAISTPSGWTSITSISTGVSTMAAFYKIATGSESGTVGVTISGSGGELGFGRMYRFTTASGVSSAGTAVDSASSTSISGVAVNTADLGVVVNLLGCRGSSTIGNLSGETGADLTESVAEYTAVGVSGIMLSCQHAETPTGATVTAGSATLGTSRPDRISIGFAITA